MIESEILESNRLFIKAWEFWAQRARAGEIYRLPGLIAPWSNVAWPICNLVFLSDPLRDEPDLEARAKAALAHGREHDRGWLLFACQEFLPDGIRESPERSFPRHGFTLVETVTGMTANRLHPPRRPLPELHFRRVEDPQTRRAFCEINALAYEVPPEWAYESLDIDSLWDDASFGFVGYVDDVAVATADVVPIDGVLYVALVATQPGHQRKGYAEATMRHSLAQAQAATGCERTVLHATPIGLPLYRDMGYDTVARFLGLLPADQGTEGLAS